MSIVWQWLGERVPMARDAIQQVRNCGKLCFLIALLCLLPIQLSLMMTPVYVYM
jgi:hypothetical protein